MRRTSLPLLLVAVMLALTAGCPRATDTPEQGKSSARGDSASGAGTSPAAAPIIQVGDETDLAKFLEANRGKAVLVDFWATWCQPCLDLLPHTLEAAGKYKDQGLAVLLVAVDEPDQLDQIKAVLEKNGAGDVTVLVCRYGVSSEAFEKFAIDGGALPYLRLYDRQGQLRTSFGVAGLAPHVERIDQEIRNLLAAPEAAPAQAQTQSNGPELSDGPEWVVPQADSPSES